MRGEHGKEKRVGPAKMEKAVIWLGDRGTAKWGRGGAESEEGPE